MYIFTYVQIHTTGVLHHSLHRAGLDAIVSSLRPDGGIHIWIYAKEGRRGINSFQNMMNMLLKNSDDDDNRVIQKERLRVARNLLLALPESNSLVRLRGEET